MSSITAGLRICPNALILVVYLASCFFVITVAPPFVIALMVVASGSGFVSRFGPIRPFAPAALSV